MATPKTEHPCLKLVLNGVFSARDASGRELAGFSRRGQALLAYPTGRPCPSSGQTMGLSSSLRPSETGSQRLVRRQPASNQEALGRMDAAKASTAGSETNCSTARSSTPYVKHRSSSKNGGSTTTPGDRTVHWDIARRPRKPSSRWNQGQSCTNNQLGPVRLGCSGRFGFFKLRLLNKKIPLRR